MRMDNPPPLNIYQDLVSSNCSSEGYSGLIAVCYYLD
jgi:hypothetical protein